MADTDNLSRRRFLQATGGAAAAGALAGCTGDGGDTTTTTTTTTKEPENELSLINSTIDTLDPIAAADTASGRVIMQLFDALTNYQDGTTTITNLLTKGYEISEDYKTYTFNLEENATFHNGDPVTASDVVYSFERLAGSSNSRRSSFILSTLGVKHETTSDGEYKSGSLAVTAVDEKTVKVELKSAFHASLQMLAYSSFSVVPEGIVGDIPGYDGRVEYQKWQANPSGTGSGPFQFDKWSSGTEARVTAYDDYYGAAPKVNSVHWQVIENDNAHYNYAMNKNADMFGIPTAFYDPEKVSVERETQKGQKLGTYGPLRNGETANYVGVPTINTYYIGFNMEAVPKPVRKAVAYAMNQQMMVDRVFKGRGQAAYHFTPPSIYPGGADQYTQHAKEQYPYGYNESRLDKAKQVMEEAGYSESEPYKLNWLQYTSDSWMEMAKILRDQLASAHIDMQIEQATFNTLLTRVRNGNMEAFTLGWIADWPAPDNFLALLDPPQTQTDVPGGSSYINWSSKTGSAATQAEQAYDVVQNNQKPTDADEKARNEAYVKIEEANWEDVGMLTVNHYIDEFFWYDTVADYTPFGGMGFSRQKLNDVVLND
ncbi:ABC transporter substrate-binding protein [Halospeciosus flavus]|uniref:ABC transporter substrate-binding protein n=1 Tax=Halospeciosus flavus TaxID=3032283 RepID=A0ABD5Z725_9EURY|nr:ABC transporter substrate-binding protein [Halospeciosus flavus]